MASQRATVTKRLLTLALREVSLEGEKITYLGTSLAVVRLLASVHSLVDSQGRSLNEHLSAAGPVADVRSDTAVDALCSPLARV